MMSVMEDAEGSCGSPQAGARGSFVGLGSLATPLSTPLASCSPMGVPSREILLYVSFERGLELGVELDDVGVLGVGVDDVGVLGVALVGV